MLGLLLLLLAAPCSKACLPAVAPPAPPPLLPLLLLPPWLPWAGVPAGTCVLAALAAPVPAGPLAAADGPVSMPYANRVRT